MSIGMEKDTKELVYGIFGTPENSLVFSCPLNLNWQCIPNYGGTSLLYNYRGFHSLGSSSKLNQSSFFIRSSWATNWICKQFINSKAQANPFGNLISSELASMLNQSGQTSEVRLLPNSFLQIDIYVNMLMMCLLPDVVVSYWIHLIPYI